MRRVAGACSAIGFIVAATAIWSQSALVTNAAGLAAVYDLIGWRGEPTAAAKIADRFPTASEMFLPPDFIREPDRSERRSLVAALAKADRQPSKVPDCAGAERSGCVLAALGGPVREAPRTVTVERQIAADTSELVRTSSKAPAASCRQDLPAATARVERALAHVRRGNAADGGEICASYRRDFFEVVKAREVTALCKTGTERAQDLGRIDAAVEDINGAIATSCGT
jgi:hypothetical protein